MCLRSFNFEADVGISGDFFWSLEYCIEAQNKYALETDLHKVKVQRDFFTLADTESKMKNKGKH